MNLRATLDDLDVLVADVQAGDEGPGAVPARAAPARRATRKPTIADLRTLVRRPGADNDLVDATRKLPELPAASPARPSRSGTRRCRRASRCSSSSAPVHRRSSSAGSATSARRRQLRRQRPLRAHPADLQRLPASTTTRPAAMLAPLPVAQRLDGLQTNHAARAARAPPAQPHADGSAPCRDSGGNLDCDPTQVLPGPMRRRRHRRRRPARRRRRRAGRRRLRGERGRRLPGARDLRQRRLRDPGRGRQGRRRQGRQGRRRRRHRGLQGRASCSTSTTRLPGLPRATRAAIVRPQSLIGERFVECTPTQKRAVDARAAAAAAADRGRAGRGPVPAAGREHEQSVDLDLINNIMRAPYRERLSIILNELGTGLAGRGADLNEVIRRADPALKEVDKVLALLASQNTQLERARRRLRHDPRAAGARARARRRRRSSNSSHGRRRRPPSGATTSRPTSRRCRAFLRELEPTMRAARRAGGRDDAGAHRPRRRTRRDINRLLLELGPFSQAAIPALDSLGEAGEDRHAGGQGRAAR